MSSWLQRRKLDAPAIPVRPAQPNPRTQAQTDRPEQLTLQVQVLRVSLATGLTLLLLGMLATFLQRSSGASPGENFTRAVIHSPHTLRAIFSGLQATQGEAWVMLGLLCMMVVPFVRVALVVLVFRHQRDRVFMVITTAVLGLLLLSLAVGKAMSARPSGVEPPAVEQPRLQEAAFGYSDASPPWEEPWPSLLYPTHRDALGSSEDALFRKR